MQKEILKICFLNICNRYFLSKLLLNDLTYHPLFILQLYLVIYR